MARTTAKPDARTTAKPDATAAGFYVRATRTGQDESGQLRHAGEVFFLKNPALFSDASKERRPNTGMFGWMERVDPAAAVTEPAAPLVSDDTNESVI